MSQREDLVKEEDKRLQEVLDKARRFTKKLLDDEDYRPPNDEIKRFKNEDAVRDSELKMSLNVTWSRRWRQRDVTPPRRHRRDRTRVYGPLPVNTMLRAGGGQGPGPHADARGRGLHGQRRRVARHQLGVRCGPGR